MRVQMIWQTPIGVMFETVREIFETQFRDALRSLAFALSSANRIDNDTYRIFQTIRRFAWPIYATSDWPERLPSSEDHPFLIASNRSFIIFLVDAGRIEVHGMGDKTNIELHSHDTGAKQHLLPIVALIKVQLIIIERDIKLEFSKTQSKLPTERTAAVGLDVADSAGQVLAMAVFEAMLSEAANFDRAKNYIQFMETKGINRIVRKSLNLLGVNSNSIAKPLGTLISRPLLKLISIAGVIFSILWYISSPGYEPLLTLFGSIAAFIGSFFGE